jgi:2-polyprenyl-3-methyl-5-hydroxy-6-metoxy-1,4-benzoquinol methylase
VSIQALDKQLTIKLTVSTEEQALIFNQQRVSLRKILTDSGYDVIDIACGIGIISPIYPSLKDIVHQRRVDVIV